MSFIDATVVNVALPVLQSALADESWEIRRLAAEHLSAEPRAAELTVDTLLRKLQLGTPAEKQRWLRKFGRSP